MPELYTAPEVAQLFRVSTWTVRRWVRDPAHPLRAVQVGQRFLFFRDDVRQILDAKRAGAP
jgi:excisionase family DNA binding protein